MASSKIICKQDTYGTHKFYVEYQGQEYYLFSQKFKSAVQEFYGAGVNIKRALDHSKAHRNPNLHRTIEKLYSHLAYVEKEYDVKILNVV